MKVDRIQAGGDGATRPTPLVGKAGRLVLLAFGLAGFTGCGREFYREWADQDVSEAVFEKSRDPRWRLDTFSKEPPAMSRFADPFDPDRNPAPPDDYATQELSPEPQRPRFRLINPAEGTGYLQMMEEWRRDSPAPAAAPNDAAPEARPPAPPEGEGPFRPEPNSGPADPEMSPNSPGEKDPATPAPDREPASGSRASRIQKIKRQDPGVLTAAFQDTNIPPPVVPPRVQVPPAQGVAPPPAAAGETAPAPVPVQDPKADDAPARVDVPPPVVADPKKPLTQAIDPTPLNADLTRPPQGRVFNEPTPFEENEMSGLLLKGTVRLDDAEAMGLPQDTQPYVITADQAYTLALINSRPYQYHLENVYLQALAVTLQRFNFTPQGYAGLSPSTGVANGGGIPQPNPANSFLYRTRGAPGGQLSTLNYGTAAGAGKLFSNGWRILGGFANQTVFNFIGKKPNQPAVQSTLPLNLVMPFLSGAGRAVTLEQLTLAERNLVYEVRNFARFRQEFLPSIMFSGQGTTNSGPTAEPSIGFLNVLQQLQAVENDRRNVAAFEQYFKVFGEMAVGQGSDITQLQVDQLDQSLQGARQSLATDVTQFRNLVDQYKFQLGLPPDTNVVLDRAILEGFRRAYDNIDRWSTRRDRQLEELPSLVEQIPDLQDVVLDGRSLVAIIDKDTNGERVDRLNDYILAAERVALENRLDLMNSRAQLYDAWRQLAVADNALKGIFNVTLTNQFVTPPTTTNPFGFSDQSKQFNLVMNAELPLVRVAQRNQYVTTQINYKRQQRILMAAEDTIKNQVRAEIRNMLLQLQTYLIQKRLFVVTLRARDQTQEQLFAPPAPGGAAGAGGSAATNTINLVNFQNRIPVSQNQLVGTWVGYVTFRVTLYRDLGIMAYDEWEAFRELFPAVTTKRPTNDTSVARASARIAVDAKARPKKIGRP